MTAGREHTSKTDTEQSFKTKCKLSCCSICTFCARAFPKERNKSRANYRNHKLKYVKSVSCVTQLSCVQPVTNVKNAVSKLPVGARLQNFWQTWLDLGAGPKLVQS